MTLPKIPVKDADLYNTISALHHAKVNNNMQLWWKLPQRNRRTAYFRDYVISLSFMNLFQKCCLSDLRTAERKPRELETRKQYLRETTLCYNKNNGCDTSRGGKKNWFPNVSIYKIALQVRMRTKNISWLSLQANKTNREEKERIQVLQAMKNLELQIAESAPNLWCERWYLAEEVTTTNQ